MSPPCLPTALALDRSELVLQLVVGTSDGASRAVPVRVWRPQITNTVPLERSVLKNAVALTVNLLSFDRSKILAGTVHLFAVFVVVNYEDLDALLLLCHVGRIVAVSIGRARSF